MVVQEDSGLRRTQVERRATAERALLDSAAELFAEQGAVETSMAQIGERAGYSRGLANHHFGSKSALIERLAQHAQEAFSESLLFPNAGTGLDAVLTIVRTYLRHFEAPTPASRALLVMWGATFPAQSSVDGIAEADDRFRLAVAKLVELGQADGSVRAEVGPAAFSVALVGMVRGITAQYLTDDTAIDASAVLAECERFVIAGLSPVHPNKETRC